jgi:hypothetical protein
VIAESDFLNNATPFGNGLGGTTISGGAIAAIAGEPNHPGVVALRDGTTAGGGYRIMTEANSLRLAGGERTICCFRRPSARTTIQFRIGYFDSTSATDPVDGVYLQYIPATGVIEARTRNNNVQTIAASTFQTVLNTWYTASVVVVSPTQAVFTIFSEAGTQLWQETITTNIPTAVNRETGAGVIATESTTDAAADIVHIDYLQVSIERNLIR